MSIYKQIEAINSARLFGKVESGSVLWHKYRNEAITGSDIAPIMGLSPWKSQLTLFYEKTGLLQQQEPTTRMLLGNYLEGGIAALFQDLNPNLTVHLDLGTWAKVEAPTFRANPDGVIEDSLGNLSILEIKHTSQYWTELPIHYRLQVLWYMYVLGLKNPATVCAVTGGDLKTFIVEYDESLVEQAVMAAQGFLGLLALGVEPDIDGSESTLETMRELTGDILDNAKELDCAIELLAAKQIYDAANANLNKFKSKALDELDGYRVGLLDGVEIVRLQRRGEGKPFLSFTKGS